MLAERDISRRYVAICNGALTGGGKIDAPIGRHPHDRTRMSIQQNGRPAVTHYTVRERYRAHTAVDVRLETGRTHQIRVHFAHRRHPLIGDPTYGGRLALPKGASPDLIEALRTFKRQALHARLLAFEHPMTGEAVEVEAPIPDDLEKLMATLRDDTP
jgi:23S rRNA pseudouridine1911/1915/1917 synthase